MSHKPAGLERAETGEDTKIPKDELIKMGEEAARRGEKEKLPPTGADRGPKSEEIIKRGGKL